MILENFNNFTRFGRIIGIDWGERRCGIAVSDVSLEFVFTRPQLNVKTQEELLEKILGVINEENAKGIVIGLPLHADLSDSETTKKVREFANALSTKTDLPIVFLEENLTSYIASENLGRGKISKIKSVLDSESARVILENAISIIKRL